MRPSPFDLFSLYHLGVDRNGAYRFRNLHGVARELGASSSEVDGWLYEYGLTATIAKHLPINLSAWHAEAQILALTGTPEDVRGFARRCFDQYRQALHQYDPRRFSFDIDYDQLDSLGEK